MAKVTRIPLGKNPGRSRIELPERVEVSLVELAGKTKQGLLAFAVAVGLDVFHTIIEEDVAGIVGQRGKHNPDRVAYRHTAERSSVTLGGRKVAVTKPRVRSLAGDEIGLPAWSAFQGDELLPSMSARSDTVPPATGLPDVGMLHRANDYHWGLPCKTLNAVPKSR